jgi:hypothetical protein
MSIIIPKLFNSLKTLGEKWTTKKEESSSQAWESLPPTGLELMHSGNPWFNDIDFML